MGERSIDGAVGAMRIYEADPDDEPRGAVIVIAEAFGVNDYVEDVVRRFAAAGYHAVSPDLFYRSGQRFAPYDDFGKVMALFEGVTADTLRADLGAVFADLAAVGFERSRVGITGFCWGGWVTLMSALTLSPGAAVTWYGGGIVEAGRLAFPPLIDEVQSLTTPWLGLFGGRDQHITHDQLDLLGKALAVSDAPNEIVIYPDADHGFHCDGRPAVFHAESAAAGWQRCTDWFDTYLR